MLNQKTIDNQSAVLFYGMDKDQAISLLEGTERSLKPLTLAQQDAKNFLITIGYFDKGDNFYNRTPNLMSLTVTSVKSKGASL